MQICLEGPRGDWDWFDFDIREPNLGLDLEKVKAATGTDDPVVIDTEYDDTGLDDILKYDGMGYTPVSNLFRQAELLQDLDDYDLERVAIYMRTKGGDLEYAVDHFDNHIYIKTDDSDPTSLAHEWIDISGEISKEMAERYFDYNQLGQELLNDGYETDSDDPYEVGEDYIDEAYGSLDLYLAEIAEDPRNGNYYNDYFDWDAYGRDLSFSNTYDEQSGVWISESVDRRTHKLHIKESESSKKYTGNTWKEFINNIESNSNYIVDSSERNMIGSRHDSILLLKPGTDTLFMGEVTRYSDGWYELMDYNIHPINNECKSFTRKNKRCVKESAIKNNIENIMYNASLVHNYDDLDVVLSSLYKLDKELYNKYQDIYRTQKIRPKQLADMIYDELSDILGQND